MMRIEYEGNQQRNSSPCPLAQYLLNVQITGETKGTEQCRIGKVYVVEKREALKVSFAC